MLKDYPLWFLTKRGGNRRTIKIRLVTRAPRSGKRSHLRILSKVSRLLFISLLEGVTSS